MSFFCKDKLDQMIAEMPSNLAFYDSCFNEIAVCARGRPLGCSQNLADDGKCGKAQLLWRVAKQRLGCLSSHVI